jgi:hypothetical protein
VLISQVITNGTGVGILPVRIPWGTIVTEGGPGQPPFILSDFGTWTVNCTWEIGTTTGLVPFAQTQNDTMKFNVGWGIWSSDLSVEYPGGLSGVLTGNSPVNSAVTVKYNLHNDYGVPQTVVNSVTLYDVLSVPIAYTAESELVPAHGVLPVTIGPISIPSWAFVGSGLVKADELSTYPSQLGIAWGPEQVCPLIILHTINPTDP